MTVESFGPYAVVNLADNTVFAVSESLIAFYRERPQYFDILPQAKQEEAKDEVKPPTTNQGRIQKQVRQLEIQSAIDSNVITY